MQYPTLTPRARVIVLGGLVAVALAVAATRLRDGDSIEYGLEAADRGDIESVVVTTGVLEALNTVIVGSQLSGQIAEIHADFNERVDEGALIARIDPRTFEARVRQNEADVRVAEASILQRRAELTRARVALGQAERDLERRKSLRARGHISEAELDADVTNVDMNRAAVEIAAAAVANAEATLAQRREALRQSELDLERTEIRAPVAGTIVNRTVEQGQTVAASLQAPELFRIAQDLHRMKVEASVDEADIGRVREGLPCRFTVDAYPERRFTGRITQVRIAPDRLLNVVTYRVIVTTDNDDLALLPGMTANVEIVLGARSDVLRVPNAALRFAPRGAEDARGTAGRSNGTPGPSGARGPGAGLLARLTADLDLSEDQRRRIDALAATARERAAPATRGADVDRAAAAQQVQSQRSAVPDALREILDDAQWRTVEARLARNRPGAAGGRPAVVWTLDDGQPVPRRIRIGLADDQMTEVLAGLEAGERVIVRASRIKDA